MASSPTAERVIRDALLVMTAVTGLVDALSFLSLGRVFTANMTGNIVLLAFATAHAASLYPLSDPPHDLYHSSNRHQLLRHTIARVSVFAVVSDR
jgi:hypothetical protein